MAFADWVVDVTNFTVALQTASPLAGVTSVQANQTVITARYFVSASGAYPQGNEIGRLRTLIRANVINNNYRFGLVCLASVRTLATTTGNWYAAFINTTGPTGSVVLYRGNAVNLGGGTQLAAGNFTFAINTPYAFQLDWIADNPGLGGTYLNVAVGTATDFSNLSSVISYVDGSTSKITTGNFEGLGGHSSTSTLLQVTYDTTSLYS